MAGQLTIDTLKASSGVLATQNGMTGIAKAWVNFNGSTAVIANSFNISSVTRNSTGNYTLNITTALSSSNYSVTGSTSRSAGGIFFVTSGTLGTTSATVFLNTSAGSAVDDSLVCVTINGA